MSSYKNNNMISLNNSSLGHWDQYFHGIELLNNTHESMSLVMNDGNCTPTYISSSLICEEEDQSSGYLEDALVEFTDRSKRRRLLMFSDEDYDSEFSNHKVSSSWELSQDLSFMSQMIGYNNELSDGTMREVKWSDEEKSSSVSEILNSSDSSYDSSTKQDSPKPNDTILYDHRDQSIMSSKQTLHFIDPNLDEKTKKKKKDEVITRVVYPFAVVKPGGIEGDMTLNDINERILMRPTRPVRHPVGDFACRPNCVSTHGPGLSGKTVVALTRIHTQGRGTITIIRTRG